MRKKLVAKEKHQKRKFIFFGNGISW